MKENQLNVGIVGGMGPLASNYFVQRLHEYVIDHDSCNSVSTIHVNDDTAPDRDPDFKGELLKFVSRKAKNLEYIGVDVISMPCVTGQMIIEDRTGDISRFCAIFESDLSSVSHRDCVILATHTSMEMGLDKKLPVGTNIRISDKSQDLIDQSIMKLKANEKNQALKLINTVMTAEELQKDATLVLGCSELSILNKDLSKDYHIADLMELYIHAILNY